MKLARRTVSVVINAISSWSRDSNVTLYDDADIFSNDIHFGINWSAIGTVTTEEAETFSDNLRLAIRLCDHLNALRATYAKGFDTDDPIMTSREDFTAAWELIYGYIKDGRYGRVCSWLEEHALPENDYFDRREETEI